MSVLYRGSVFLLVPLCLTLGACGKRQTLDEAVKCDQFKQRPDGSWTTKDVSIDFVHDDKYYQLNYHDASIVTGKNDGAEALLLNALKRKCVESR